MSALQQVYKACWAGVSKQAWCFQQLSCHQLVAKTSLGGLARGYAVMPDRQQQLYQVVQKPTPQQQQQQQQQHQQKQQQAPSIAQQQQRDQQPHHEQPCPNQPVEKIYRGKWIVPVRFLVRAKVFQLLGGGSIGVTLGTMTLQEATWLDIFALTGLAGGMVAASCCLWYYSRRYVGEMALLLPDRQTVRFSVLDFWGNRENNDVPVSHIVPPFKGVRPKEMSRIASQLLFPVNVANDRQYYLSIHAGQIFNPKAFFGILKGDFEPNDTAPSATAAENSAPLAAQQPAGEQQ